MLSSLTRQRQKAGPVSWEGGRNYGIIKLSLLL